MKHLKTQNELDYLIRLFSDDHCFVRECHLISPSYITEGALSTVAAESLPGVRIWITSPNEVSPGVELVLYDVKRLCLDFELPFIIKGFVEDNEIRLSFSASMDFDIIAKICYYELLGSCSLGPELRFGYENIYDRGGFSTL